MARFLRFSEARLNGLYADIETYQGIRKVVQKPFLVGLETVMWA